ncbi:MAG: hypothetical protein ACTSVI_00770 [Promethearchaeota archaeon]
MTQTNYLESNNIKSRVNNLERELYFPIIDEYKNNQPNLNLILKKIITVFSDKNSNEIRKSLYSSSIRRNMLLLALGVMHRNRPIDDFGKDIWSLPRQKLIKIQEDLEAAFL